MSDERMSELAEQLSDVQSRVLIGWLRRQHLHESADNIDHLLSALKAERSEVDRITAEKEAAVKGEIQAIALVNEAQRISKDALALVEAAEAALKEDRERARNGCTRLGGTPCDPWLNFPYNI